MIATIAVTATLVLLSNVCLCWYFSREMQHLEQQQYRNTCKLDQSIREFRDSVDALGDDVTHLKHTIQSTTSTETSDDSDWWRNA